MELNVQAINKKGIERMPKKVLGVYGIVSLFYWISLLTDSISIILCSNTSFEIKERFFAFVL